MFKPFRTAAVLGAGVMGTQIAAHLANVGLTVHLLDIPAKDGEKNKIVETAFKKALKQTPPIFYTEKTARRVILGNFDEHFNRIADVDWVIEAVVENLDIKQQLMERVEKEINDQAVISSNTSGLPIQAIAQGRSDSFRSRFMGVHFFNPPRYLKLLELIPTEDTHPQVLKRMQWFGRLHLGKGTVVAKDTPNFIANRIGVYVSMLGLDAFINQGYTIEEIDTLTGTLAGRPRSGTFRTADLVGLDTLMYVADNLYPSIPHDESRDMFQVPDLLRKLVETGTLGAKTRQGFYKKVDKEILSLNLKTLAYEAAKPLKLGKIDAIKEIKDLPERLRALYQDSGRAGAFFRQSILKTLSYSACRIPEIADNPADIDRAMRWGFGWELGPFQIWDALGFETVLSDMKAANIPMPDWLEKMRQTGAGSFYWNGHGVYGPVGQVYELMQTCPDEIKLSKLKSDPERTLWENSEAALIDLGDGVVLFEFRSKGNTLSTKVVEGLNQALDRLETDDCCGLVIGNDEPNFSLGANLAEMGALAMKDRFNPFTKRSESGIAQVIVQFQTLMQRIHYFPKPIVAAVQGRALGGGCELAMACPQVVAAAESYIGLVELGVGLIPGAGGIMRMAAIAAERAATDSHQHIQPFLKSAFETIAMAKVANSAYEAKELGFLSPSAQIVINADRRLYVAKQEVLRLDREGYYPPAERNAVRVLGRPARTVFEHAAYIMLQGGFISEYDRYLADRLAYVITGGDLTAPALVHEDYLLQLERETFLPLLDQKKTQERVMHLLKTKKPLRN
ncbi:MAG: 3-hydroxyacyl-CoA dehydrogenase NAD-binding domain-containing protein [Leptolyngbyaceae cyanobacterium MO_188.B28]|nr:3-hydroxyacyl-CoA dehydrogenase NAD-binding domain-containing protein [Leptolyngbyaceae cyanobacterium MO_188.B28]